MRSKNVLKAVTPHRALALLNMLRRDRNITIIATRVLYLGIDKVKIDLLLDLVQDMILRDSSLKANVAIKGLRLKTTLITHHGKLHTYCVCLTYT
jgi:hypothetical protein